VPTFPYSSGQGAVVQTFAQLRKGFPPKVDAGYLKRFSIGSANESYIIAILRFLDLINEEGERREGTTQFFFAGDDGFKTGLEERLKDAYSQVFDEMGDDALTAERDALTNWFRAADKTSALVGQRQASTFRTLLALAGHGDVPASRAVSGAKKPDARTSKPTAKPSSTTVTDAGRTAPIEKSTNTSTSTAVETAGVSLTVRIEVNLPPGGDASTYDAIFASIKKHLMS
jgi:Family of unknown function (DUF5343)